MGTISECFTNWRSRQKTVSSHFRVKLIRIPKNWQQKMRQKKISGVKAIAEDIHIGVSPAYNKTDAEIAEAVVNALRWHAAVLDNKIKIKVEDAVVKLEGEVEWEYQRTQARYAVENLVGVRSVTNLISVKSKASPSDVQRKIAAAFQRHASLDAQRIKTEVIGSKAILRGNVRSLAEKEDAAEAAWSAPGIMTVDNKLEVVEEEYAF